MRLPHRSHTTHTRDAALRDLHRINRWMIAASVVLTGVLSDVAANAFPGKSAKHASASPPKTAKKKHASKTSTGVLRAPAQPPAHAESEPAQESPPSEPAQESAPSEPAQEAAPSQEAAPEQEAAPVQEAAPEPEPSREAPAEAEAPVVSGGS